MRRPTLAGAAVSGQAWSQASEGCAAGAAAVAVPETERADGSVLQAARVAISANAGRMWSMAGFRGPRGAYRKECGVGLPPSQPPPVRCAHGGGARSEGACQQPELAESS